MRSRLAPILAASWGWMIPGWAATINSIDVVPAIIAVAMIQASRSGPIWRSAIRVVAKPISSARLTTASATASERSAGPPFPWCDSSSMAIAISGSTRTVWGSGVQIPRRIAIVPYGVCGRDRSALTNRKFDASRYATAGDFPTAYPALFYARS